ncbi:hypothetical protein FQA39_LY13826 [Lamprigera yunnana]|nr:hypothetical protein FQA39_LY13826 [Lamprigera yunnana]
MVDKVKLSITEYIKNMFGDNDETKHKIYVEFPTNCSLHYVSEAGKAVIQEQDAIGGKKNVYLWIKVAKIAECRKVLAVKELFARETYVYKNIFPLFEKIQKENNIKNVFEPYPKFYESCVIDGRELILLDDMLKKNFKVCECYQTLNYSEALILMKEVGRLHAISFALKDQHPKLFNGLLSELTDLEFSGAMEQTAKYVAKSMVSSCLKILDFDKDHLIYEKLISLENIFFDTLVSCTDIQKIEPYAVIIHGDLWSTNLMFKYNETFSPTEVCLLDWQTTKVSSPAVDISQIMFTCLNKELRNLHIDDLLKEYYNSFSNFLKEFGGKPEVFLPFEVLQKHLQVYSVTALYVTMKTVKGMAVLPEDMPADNDCNFLQRLCYARVDAKKYDNRMRDILFDFIKYGYDLGDNQLCVANV